MMEVAMDPSAGLMVATMKNWRSGVILSLNILSKERKRLACDCSLDEENAQ